MLATSCFLNSLMHVCLLGGSDVSTLATGPSWQLPGKPEHIEPQGFPPESSNAGRSQSLQQSRGVREAVLNEA